MTPEQWGPPIWIFFHTFVEKIKEDTYSIVAPQLFSYFYRISNYLPCPSCSMHARKFLSNVKFSEIKTKQDFVNLMYIFHNIANKTQKKALYPSEGLKVYENKNLLEVYNQFIAVYNTKGNMRLLTETFHRDILVKEFKKWLKENLKYFNP